MIMLPSGFRIRNYPRLRGEYDTLDAQSSNALELPPLARGIRGVVSVQAANWGITPACAGNTLGRLLVELVLLNYPRLRGEYSASAAFSFFSMELPPLARGILLPLISAVLSVGITPACAGNTKWNVAHCYSPWNYPRLRGEYT